MMVKVYNAAQLATQPSGSLEIPSKFPQERAAWFHIINLSPYVFEVQDDTGAVRTVVSAVRERAVRLKVRTDRLQLVAVATETIAATLPTTAFAVYAEVLDEQPLMQGVLVT